MNVLQLALVQFNIQWREKSTNFRKIESLLQSVTDVDLIVLPEMFQTGFSVKEPQEAESMDGPSVQFMHDLARKHQAVVAGGLMIAEGNKFFNRFVVADEARVLSFYDKQHLFKLSAEGEHFTAGDDKVDVLIKGFKCRLATCYDLRFPYVTYNDSSYDVLLLGANWPVQRIRHWDRLLQARSIENQAYVVGVNRVGIDPFDVQYPGHSSVYAPDGRRLLRFIGEEVRTLRIEQQEVQRIREKLPFLKDQKS